MNLDRVASLLSGGLKPVQVATIIGCTPARISQLLQEESFKLLLQEKTILIEEKDIEEVTLSNKYNAAEHALINQVMEMAPSSELRDVTAALRVVGERQEKMKSRLSPVQQNPTHLVQVVSITLPSQALPGRTIEMTAQKEVISIGEQTLAPLPSTAVTNLFTRMKNKLIIKGDENVPSSNTTSTERSSTETILPKEEGFLRYASA